MRHEWVTAIGDVRRYLRMTQLEFAVLCEVSPRTVQRWESGDCDRCVPFGAVMALSEALAPAGYALILDDGDLRMVER